MCYTLHGFTWLFVPHTCLQVQCTVFRINLIIYSRIHPGVFVNVLLVVCLYCAAYGVVVNNACGGFSAKWLAGSVQVDKCFFDKLLCWQSDVTCILCNTPELQRVQHLCPLAFPDMLALTRYGLYGQVHRLFGTGLASVQSVNIRVFAVCCVLACVCRLQYRILGLSSTYAKTQGPDSNLEIAPLPMLYERCPCFPNPLGQLARSFPVVMSCDHRM